MGFSSPTVPLKIQRPPKRGISRKGVEEASISDRVVEGSPMRPMHPDATLDPPFQGSGPYRKRARFDHAIPWSFNQLPWGKGDGKVYLDPTDRPGPLTWTLQT